MIEKSQLGDKQEKGRKNGGHREGATNLRGLTYKVLKKGKGRDQKSQSSLPKIDQCQELEVHDSTGGGPEEAAN